MGSILDSVSSKSHASKCMCTTYRTNDTKKGIVYPKYFSNIFRKFGHMLSIRKSKGQNTIIAVQNFSQRLTQCINKLYIQILIPLFNLNLTKYSFFHITARLSSLPWTTRNLVMLKSRIKNQLMYIRSASFAKVRSLKVLKEQMLCFMKLKLLLACVSQIILSQIGLSPNLKYRILCENAKRYLYIHRLK